MSKPREVPDDDLVKASERDPRVAYEIVDGKLVEVPVPTRASDPPTQ